MEELDIGQSALLTDISLCLNYYRLFTSGIYVCTNIPIRLKNEIKITPCLMSMVNHGEYKQCEPNYKDNTFDGPPNFVIDIESKNNLGIFQERKKVFEANQVLEYLIIQDTHPLTFEWNSLKDGKYITLKADDHGLIKSQALPGFWISENALKNRDWRTIMSTIQFGISRKEHHDFMNTIWN